jgi:hypothetical protein
MTFLASLEGFVYDYLAEIKALLAMVKGEARLAGLSVLPLLLSLVCLFVVVITTWLSLLVLMGYCFLWATGSLFLSLSSVFISNLLLLLGLIISVKFNFRQMTFEKTRRYFSHEGSKNEDLQKTGKG